MTKNCSVCGFECGHAAKFCSECGSALPARVETYDAFISYRRDRSSDLAALLKVQLETKYRKHVFLDIHGLKGGRSVESLLDIIGNTPNFVLVLNGDALKRCVDKRDWLKREIVHAFETKRTIIPIRVDGFKFPSKSELDLLPQAIRALPNLNAVLYSHVHGDSAIRKVAETLTSSATGAASNKVTKISRPRNKVSSEAQPTRPNLVGRANEIAEKMRDRMVSVPSGESLMGNDQTGRVPVTITWPFLMDKYPITQAIRRGTFQPMWRSCNPRVAERLP